MINGKSLEYNYSKRNEKRNEFVRLKGGVYMWWLIGIGGLLFFGFLVDWAYKRNGIHNIDPEENAKHVSSSERVYMESHFHNMRNDHRNGGF
jgi:hypothetical protein